MRNRNIYSLLFILFLVGLALLINFAPADADGTPRFLGRDVGIRLGLDLRGGIQVLLRSQQADVSRTDMQTAAGVIERRVNALGVGETVVQLSGDDSLIVELPGVENPEQAIETLRGTGRLEFIDPQGQFLPNNQLVRTSGNPDPIGADTSPLIEEIDSVELEGTETLDDQAFDELPLEASGRSTGPTSCCS